MIAVHYNARTRKPVANFCCSKWAPPWTVQPLPEASTGDMLGGPASKRIRPRRHNSCFESGLSPSRTYGTSDEPPLTETSSLASVGDTRTSADESCGSRRFRMHGARKQLRSFLRPLLKGGVAGVVDEADDGLDLAGTGGSEENGAGGSMLLGLTTKISLSHWRSEEAGTLLSCLSDSNCTMSEKLVEPVCVWIETGGWLMHGRTRVQPAHYVPCTVAA